MLDWLSLFVRWFHVIAGVAWIGASFYFIWLDNNLRTPPDWKKQKGIKGDLWAVHGGGFYEVAKYNYGPETMPETLHWFKWEAYSTWLSGMLLLGIVYYHGAAVYLIDNQVMAMSANEAIWRGLGLIFGALLIYEAACRSALARFPTLFGLALLVVLLTLTAYLAAHWFSGRGAFIHVGAVIGTIMAGNVFFKIMPAQRQMVHAVANKHMIDPAWGAAAKLRSVHNNYFTLPLLFIMISNHYPMTYQHPDNWLVLVAIGIVSAWIRHYFNLKHLGISRPSILITGALGMLIIAYWVAKPLPSVEQNLQTNMESAAIAPLSELETHVMTIMQTHCANCHSAQPSDDIFVVAPMGLMFDSWQQIESRAAIIHQRAAVSKDMPLMNKTNMTEAERQVIATWFQQLSQH